MEDAHPTPPPNPELLNRQPIWVKPAFYGCIIVSILFFIALLTAPITLRSRKKAEQAEATSNARQIGLALFEFENEYGAFPSPATAALVTKNHPAHGLNLSGTSSNSLFRQLIAAKLTDSEQMFYAQTKNSRKPDNIITLDEALKKTEVCFAYISNHATAGHPARPLLLSPLIPSTTKFDPKPFKGKAIVLRIDNSVTSYTIHKDGNIYDDKGLNLLSPTHPIWNGHPPTIHYPE